KNVDRWVRSLPAGACARVAGAGPVPGHARVRLTRPGGEPLKERVSRCGALAKVVWYLPSTLADGNTAAPGAFWARRPRPPLRRRPGPAGKVVETHHALPVPDQQATAAVQCRPS